MADAARPWPCCQDPSAEEWRPVAGYERFYAVSSYGRVVRIAVTSGSRPGRFQTAHLDRKGYPRVHLSANWQATQMYLHKVVAMTFLGVRPDGWQTNHKDGDKLHCCVGNLEYVGPGENQAHAVATGLYKRGVQLPGARITEDDVREIRRLRGQIPQRQLARRFGLAQSTVKDIQLRRAWRHVD